ncbi:formylglycine-generating enzyme family protein [Sunxiuqinia sp. sy24]|uniref:formylglycine-generating enzyme family protein n=1 Tax=Sunxiuqinia sp. sy24 TaxID=3461495 RepID=UPI0040453034
MQIKLLTIAITGCLIASCSNSSTSSKQAVNQPDKTQQPELSEFTAQTAPDYTNMVQFPDGSYFVGSKKGLPNEQPVHAVDLNAFYIDQSPVTVAQFRAFIKATGYKTEADRFGDSGVFNFTTNQWELTKGVNWEYPLGPDNNKAADNHPVTHVSWNDATAYAAWASKRLPTEAEWEVAAKSGKNSEQRFSWGDQLVENGQYKANVWQGDEVNHNSNEDGYRLTSPIGAFGKNEAGLTDMGGNVWNWCADTYQPYPGNNMPFRKDETVKVIRGGSFFFDQNGEDSFTVSGRSFNSHETSLFNTGFRCAADVK